jgi:hypothetical protein
MPVNPRDPPPEAELRAVLSGEKAHQPRKKIIRPTPDKKVNLLVDIQAKLRAGKGVGYERWAKLFNRATRLQTTTILQGLKLCRLMSI